MWAAVAALPAAGTSPCCHSETVGCSQGSASPLQLPLRGMRGHLCVPSVKCRGRFPLPRRSLSAFEQEVNEYSCAICVLPQTWATGCPGPASKPCGLGVAFLCLQIHSDVPIHVHLFLDWACSDLSVTFARLRAARVQLFSSRIPGVFTDFTSSETLCLAIPGREHFS